MALVVDPRFVQLDELKTTLVPPERSESVKNIILDGIRMAVRWAAFHPGRGCLKEVSGSGFEPWFSERPVSEELQLCGFGAGHTRCVPSGHSLALDEWQKCFRSWAILDPGFLARALASSGHAGAAQEYFGWLSVCGCKS